MNQENPLLDAQVELERRYSKKNTNAYVRGLMGYIEELGKYADELTDALLAYVPSENDPAGLSEIVPLMLDMDIDDILHDIVSYVLTRNGEWCTIQEVIGSQLKKLDSIEEMPNKLLACTYFVSAACRCKYIEDRVRTGYQTLIRSTFQFNDEVMNHIRNQGYVLPSIIPLRPITNNYESGYHTFNKSVILGGKGHKYNVCLSHINRVNSVPFQYEERLRKVVEPVFNEEPEVKKDGTWETDIDIEKRRQSFNALHVALPDRIDAVQEHSNIFYLAHGYCTRGRTHVNAHEYNYMGTKFLKGMIDLAELEIIKQEW